MHSNTQTHTPDGSYFIYWFVFQRQVVSYKIFPKAFFCHLPVLSRSAVCSTLSVSCWAVEPPRSGCLFASSSSWMPTELIGWAAASADRWRRVLGAGDGAAATSHHRHKTSSSSQAIIVSLWRIPGGARDIWASLIFVSFLFTSLVALLKYHPSTNTNNSVF